MIDQALDKIVCDRRSQHQKMMAIKNMLSKTIIKQSSPMLSSSAMVWFLALIGLCANAYVSTKTGVIMSHIHDCIVNKLYSESNSSRTNINYQVAADAQLHFKTIMRMTEKYRLMPVHHYAGYRGPWIENLFISKFIKKPLEFFGGAIPLFIQWVDTELATKYNTEQLRATLSRLLRPNVIYVTVSQSDVGLGAAIMHQHPNILVFSAGGHGHIPIPLIKGSLPYIPPPATYRYNLGFYGNMRVEREELFRPLLAAAARYNLTFANNTIAGSDWIDNINNTKWNLAPRGFGRTSFRTAEIIQMGRIPIYLYSGVPWIPYAKSNISFLSFGFIADVNNITSLEQQLSALSSAEYESRMQRVKEVRGWYRYEGVLDQIERWISEADDCYLTCVEASR